MTAKRILCILTAVLLAAACLPAALASETELNAEIKEATPYTVEASAQVYALLDFDDTRELENARKGLSRRRNPWRSGMKTAKSYEARTRTPSWRRTLRQRPTRASGGTRS